MDNRSTQGKRYGLQAPKKPTLGTVQPRLAVFGDDSDSENDDGSDWVKKAFSKQASQNVQKRQTKLEIQRALKEDPTVYQYDEIYEQLEEKKQEAKSEKVAQERKPRYIQTLMAHAEQRKREQERRTERQVQKEREAEGEAFKDKEAFITASYRKKLEEFRIQDEEERRRDALEAIADVSKQKDLSGFYRHLYRQTMGEDKPTIKQENISDGEEEAEVKKKRDESDSKQSISVKKSDEDSNINKEQESDITEEKEHHKERNPTLPSTEVKREKPDNTDVSHVNDQAALSETKEKTSKNKPEEHDKNKRFPLCEISRKLVSEKHYANESNQDADTDISSSDSDSDAENKDKSRRRKKEAFRSRQYRRRQSSSSEESSSSEAESENSVILNENRADRDTDKNTGRRESKVEEKAPVLKTSSAPNEHRMTNGDIKPNERRMINGDIKEAEKENKTNVKKENRRGTVKKPDLSIYEKRTVGAKFEEARRKFLERRAAREAKNIFF